MESWRNVNYSVSCARVRIPSGPQRNQAVPNTMRCLVQLARLPYLSISYNLPDELYPSRRIVADGMAQEISGYLDSSN
jgi:hypothetical protein